MRASSILKFWFNLNLKRWSKNGLKSYFSTLKYNRLKPNQNDIHKEVFPSLLTFMKAKMNSNWKSWDVYWIFQQSQYLLTFISNILILLFPSSLLPSYSYSIIPCLDSICKNIYITKHKYFCYSACFLWYYQVWRKGKSALQKFP